MWRPRYLARSLAEDALAKRKIAFVSGPRQVGKSMLARSLLASDANYFLREYPAYGVTVIDYESFFAGLM